MIIIALKQALNMFTDPTSQDGYMVYLHVMYFLFNQRDNVFSNIFCFYTVVGSHYFREFGWFAQTSVYYKYSLCIASQKVFSLSKNFQAILQPSV